MAMLACRHVGRSDGSRLTPTPPPSSLVAVTLVASPGTGTQTLS